MAFRPFPICLLLMLTSLKLKSAQAEATKLCRSSCGNIPINYPFGIDDGCGSLYYRNILFCTTSGKLELRTTTGTYPVTAISYSDPYILISDPDMWACRDGPNFRPARPFTLDPGTTHLSVSPLNHYLFFNCSEEEVVIAPKPRFCGRFPERCDEGACDSASYLCTHVPECGGGALGGSSCCSYLPKGMDSMRMMLEYCASYTSVYWRSVSVEDDQVPEYGIRIDFDIVVTSSCLRCQDVLKGGGACGFNVQTLDFSCLCDHNNVTTYCQDQSMSGVGNRHRLIAGTVSAVSAAGALGIAAGILFLKKIKAKAPVTCGVQTNENRLF